MVPAAERSRCEQATVYDNSGIKGPRIVAQTSDGFIVGSSTWPHWTPRELTAPSGHGHGRADRI